MFEWSSRYSVGIASIDSQHRTLFALAKALHAAISTGQGKAACARILERLIRYTATHFAHEERLMRLHAYPEFEAHKAEHDALTRQVLQFQSDLVQGQAPITVQLLRFLQTWLALHIQGSDKNYVPFLIGKSVA